MAEVRKTMAPAARRPTGEDEKPANERESRVDALARLSDAELDELAGDIAAARRRRSRTPREPSFGMSEGERDELERTGRTVSPFTGEKRGDWPDEPAPR